MNLNILGIHHITAISSNPQKTYDFYTKILGLRLVKKTVNFDSPGTYHFYFGDNTGTPGTILTFFPFPEAGTGMRGTSQVASIGFSVPVESLGFWLQHFVTKGVKHENIKNKFGQSFLTFYDPDGLQLELYATKETMNAQRWSESTIPAEHEIKGFFNATLWVDDLVKTEEILIKLLGYKVESTEELLTRYSLETNAKDSAKYLDVLSMKGWPEGISSAGTVHHIAFAMQGYDSEVEFIHKIRSFGLNPTSQIDRNYFKSVYFREPNQILFEIATLEPGFLIDETLEELGTNLKLPEKYEDFRESIERNLPPLYTNNDLMTSDEVEPKPEDDYVYKYDKGSSDLTFVLLHGTGGDENDLIPFAKSINDKANILSLRGDTDEYGALRFFKRLAEGVFDQDDIKSKVEKLRNFLERTIDKYNIDLDKTVFIGYSNGANMIASLLLTHPSLVKNSILIRTVNPLDDFKSNEISNDNNVLILSGSNDPFAPDSKVELLVENLKKIGISNVSRVVTGIGHSINEKDSLEIKKFIKFITD